MGVDDGGTASVTGPTDGFADDAENSDGVVAIDIDLDDGARGIERAITKYEKNNRPEILPGLGKEYGGCGGVEIGPGKNCEGDAVTVFGALLQQGFSEQRTVVGDDDGFFMSDGIERASVGGSGKDVRGLDGECRGNSSSFTYDRDESLGLCPEAALDHGIIDPAEHGMGDWKFLGHLRFLFS